MAIYHLSAKPVQRSKGQSVVAKMAYRAGEKLKDDRTGKTHDYRKKGKNGVLHTQIITPQGVTAPERQALWNMAEQAEKRKDACLGKEYEFNLPHELDHQDRIAICDEMGEWLADEYSIAVDYAIHAPNKRGDQRNFHCHMMTTTRKITNDGLGEKADLEKAGRKRKDDLKAIRAKFADIVNSHLERKGLAERIDHRSNKDRGIDQTPTKKQGWLATQIEYKADEMNAKGLTAERSYIGDINRQIKDRNNRISDLERLDKSRFTQFDSIKFNNYFEKATHTELVNDIQNYAEIAYHIKVKAETEKLTRADIEQYTYAKSFLNGIDDSRLEQKYHAEIAQEQARLEADTAKQANVSNEADQIKKQVDTLKNIVGIVTQQLYERYSQVQPSQLKTLAELHQTVIDGLDDMASREVITDFDSKVVEYSDSKNNLATIDQVTGRLAQLKAERERLKQAVSTAPQPRPEPQQSIVRSDKGNAPQLTPTPTPEPRPEPQAQPSDRAKLKAKLEEMQNARLQETIERNRELERELERLNQREQHPEQSAEREPQPQTPPTVAERLEMVSIDPRLNYETRKGLEQLKAHIEAMPSGERQNLAIIEFNKVVGEQLEQQQSQSKGMDR